jgi:hypothetical protein
VEALGSNDQDKFAVVVGSEDGILLSTTDCLNISQPCKVVGGRQIMTQLQLEIPGWHLENAVAGALAPFP